jgi:hypothetical protein
VQVGTAQVGTVQVGTAQVGTVQVGIMQVGKLFFCSVLEFDFHFVLLFVFALPGGRACLSSSCHHAFYFCPVGIRGTSPRVWGKGRKT